MKGFGLFVNKGHTTFDILPLEREIFNFLKIGPSIAI
jgi:hypothetical protein